MHDSHAEDEYLLFNDFHKLLLSKQQKIRKILVSGFRNHFFSASEVDDVFQEINRILLEKANYYRTKYIHKSTPDAYLHSIIYHECCRFSNEFHKNHDPLESLDQHEFKQSGHNLSPLETLAVVDEIKRFDAVIKLYPGKKSLYELLIKILCRYPIKSPDVAQAYNGFNEKLCRSVAEKLNEHSEISDIELFRILVFEISKNGLITIQPDSLLRMIRNRIHEMIELLNTRSKFRSAYDYETFMILAEKYFAEKEKGIGVHSGTLNLYILLILAVINF